MRIPLEHISYFDIYHAYLAANVRKCYRCLVGYHFLGDYRASDLILKGFIWDQAFEYFIKRGVKQSVCADIFEQAAANAQIVRNIKQLARRERCALDRTLAGIGYINYLTE